MLLNSFRIILILRSQSCKVIIIKQNHPKFMQLKLEESCKKQQVNNYDGYNAFRTTSLGFKKNQRHQNGSPFFFTTFRSHKLKNSSKKLIITNNSSPTNLDLSCSRFMKGYIDKLKKQRKRQNKKYKSFKQKKHQSLNKTDELPLCKGNNSKKIVLLDRVNTNNSKNTINTISIVSKDMYEVTPYGESKTRKVSTPLENPSWLKKQKLNELISGVRKSSSKQLMTDHVLEGRAQFIQRDLAKKMLVQSRKPRDRTGVVSELKTEKCENKKKKKDLFHNFKQLEPWKEQKIYQDYTIEDFAKL